MFFVDVWKLFLFSWIERIEILNGVCWLGEYEWNDEWDDEWNDVCWLGGYEWMNS